MAIARILLICLTILIWSCESKNGFVPSENHTWCVTKTYRMPLFSTRFFRLKLNRALLKQHQIVSVRTIASIADRKVIQFDNNAKNITKKLNLRNSDRAFLNRSMVLIDSKVRADYMNYTFIHYTIEMTASNGRITHINCSIVVLVSQPLRLVDKIFKGSIPYFIPFILIQMGILLDLEVLQEIVFHPVPVLIGFCCQYGLMPLIAYAISKIFNYSPLYGLGLFVVGCCPGGAVSNQWTVMFDGDLNLSAFMSFASTVASFIMMPIWLYTLGQYAYLRHMKIHIPFLGLAKSLLSIIGPFGIGMILVYFIPKLKRIVERILKPMLFLLLFYFFIFGSYVNYYLFRYIDLKTALTTPLLPWLGYILGGCAAWCLQQDWKRIKTIGIEAGIQNVGIAFMVLLYSFPEPENTQATIIPLIVAYLSAQPFYIALLYRAIRRKCFNKKKQIKPKTIDDNISSDTLNNTTRNLSECEEVDESNKVPLPPVSLLGFSADTKPTEV